MYKDYRAGLFDLLRGAESIKFRTKNEELINIGILYAQFYLVFSKVHPITGRQGPHGEY